MTQGESPESNKEPKTMVFSLRQMASSPTMAYGRWLLRPACLPVAAHADIIMSAAHRSRTCKPVLPAHCLPDSSSTIEGLRRIVGRVGLEPTWPEGNGFTDRLLHSICISADIV